MDKITPVTKTAKYLSILAAVILLLIPFHAFLTVWGAGLFGHYTLLRLWKEILLLPIVLWAVYILLADKGLRQKLLSNWLARCIGAYFLVLIICGAVALANHSVSAKAMWYGLLVDARFLVFFLALVVLAARSDWLYKRWQPILLAPAIFVAAFAVLQYLVLPYDFLKHFGYSDSTIPPYETINHNIHHIRVMSTLRGANPLGAYLVVPICTLAVWLFKQRRERLDKSIFGGGLILALIFSFSRSAWIGAVIGVAAAAWFSLKSLKAKKLAGWITIALLAAATILTVVLRNNLTYENFIFHTDRASTISTSSNQGHSAAFKSAAKDIIHQPLGAGVGSAGPQSVYNNHPARIAENYYLQIGQEAGLIGAVLFIAIIVLTGKALYGLRADPLALALLASLIGLSFVNLLSHAWEDDTLAYVWWGLAGISLSPAILTDRHKRKNGKKIKTAA
jgi:O-antigen ligase